MLPTRRGSVKPSEMVPGDSLPNLLGRLQRGITARGVIREGERRRNAHGDELTGIARIRLLPVQARDTYRQPAVRQHDLLRVPIDIPPRGARLAHEYDIREILEIVDQHLSRGPCAPPCDHHEPPRRVVTRLDEAPNDVAIPRSVASAVQPQIQDEALRSR